MRCIGSMLSALRDSRLRIMNDRVNLLDRGADIYPGGEAENFETW
jgi:hypothetical protein